MKIAILLLVAFLGLASCQYYTRSDFNGTTCMGSALFEAVFPTGCVPSEDGKTSMKTVCGTSSLVVYFCTDKACGTCPHNETHTFTQCITDGMSHSSQYNCASSPPTPSSGTVTNTVYPASAMGCKGAFLTEEIEMLGGCRMAGRNNYMMMKCGTNGTVIENCSDNMCTKCTAGRTIPACDKDENGNSVSMIVDS